MINNIFLNELTTLPNKKHLDEMLKGCLIMVCIFTPGIFWYYFHTIKKSNINIFPLLISFIIIFSIIHFSFKKVFIKKPHIFFLYTSTCFFIFSLSLTWLSYNLIYIKFNSPLNLILISISLLIYLLLVLLTFIKVNKKLKSNQIASKKLSSETTKIFISLSVILGILFFKNLDTTSYIWIISLILSFCCAPTLIGFYRYYLCLKINKKNKGII